MLTVRPYSKNWNDVVFADKFYVRIRTHTIKKIKRKIGPKYKYKKKNVHYKKVSSKEVKAKVRENEHLKLLYVYATIKLFYIKLIMEYVKA